MPAHESADEALAQIDTDIESAAERARAATAWRRQAETLRGEGGSRDGDVLVTVDMTGLLTGLTITDAACQRGGQEVRQRVLDALREAQQDVRGKVLSSSEDAFGADSSVTAQLDRELGQRFGHFDDDVREADERRGPHGIDIDW